MSKESVAAAAAQSAQSQDLTQILFPKGGKAAPTDGAAADKTGDDLEDADDSDADDDDDDDDAAAGNEAVDDSTEDDAGNDAAEEADETGDDDDQDEGEDGGDADDADDPDLDADDKAARAKFTPEQQKRFDKAIGKKVAKLKQSEAELAKRDERIATLEAEVQSAAPKATATAADPLADVETEAQLEAKIANAKTWRRWLRMNPDGGTVGEGDQARDVTAEDARQLAVFYDDVLTEHVPARRDFLAKAAAAEGEARKVYVWLKDKANPGTVEIEAALRKSPALRGVPDIRLILADAYMQRVARKTKAAAAKAGTKPGLTPGGKKTVPAASASPGGAARPPKASAGKAAVKAVERVQKTGQDPDNAALRNLLFNPAS